MTTIPQEDSLPSFAITVRLEPELAERLRVASFQQRIKKQPLLRLALNRFFQSVRGKKGQHLLKQLRVPPAEPPTVAEKLLLDRAANERLRKFVYEHATHKQHVVRLALIEYLAELDRK